ncbi:MAG TPA: hypothetical protein VFF33_14255 [Ignavibacteriaceae bacterium]|nr:hypothetical protein [Ignavibacteriaceae bacterium]
MKKLFTNYNFDFDKNEKKILTTFVKQIFKQSSADEKYFQQSKTSASILDKLNENGETVRFTKAEREFLKLNLETTLAHYKKETSKAGFLKKWLYKSMIKQYDNILNKHFKG